MSTWAIQELEDRRHSTPINFLEGNSDVTVENMSTATPSLKIRLPAAAAHTLEGGSSRLPVPSTTISGLALAPFTRSLPSPGYSIWNTYIWTPWTPPAIPWSPYGMTFG